MKIGKLDLSRNTLAQLMDYSTLNPDVDEAEIRDCCEISVKYNFKGFHVNPVWVELVASILGGTGIETGYPLSFPFGTNPTEVKVAEAKHAAKLLEGKPAVIDMVAHSGKLKSREYEYYRNDIAQVVRIGHDAGIEVKAILEVSLLSDEETRIACELATEAGVDWVKSSTGRHGGPSLERVVLMRGSVPPSVKVKIAGTGSFWTPMVALGCILAGAERLGTRNAPWIVDELSGLIPELFNKAL